MRHSLISLAVAAVAAGLALGATPANAASLPKLDTATSRAASPVETVGYYRRRGYRPYYRGYGYRPYYRPYYAPRRYYGYRPYYRPYGYRYRPYYGRRYWW